MTTEPVHSPTLGTWVLFARMSFWVGIGVILISLANNVVDLPVYQLGAGVVLVALGISILTFVYED